MNAAPPDPLTELVRSWGPDGRRLERVVGALVDGGTMAELVARTGASRRTVEEVVRSLGEHVRAEGEHLRLDDDPLPPTAPLPTADELSSRIAPLLAERPSPATALDHVAATTGTLARRALLLADRFRLHDHHVLLLGDHDLTSLALDTLDNGARITVIDVDRRVLAHIAATAPAVTTIAADLRDGLPDALAGTADIVVTDPPYSPDGVGLFVALGVEALADHDHGRIVLAYGHGEQHPALGFKVQDQLNRLRLTIEALLPDFNQYVGAEAIGSRSDLYLLRPTRRSRAAAATRIRATERHIYTKGGEAQPRRR